MVCLHPAFAYRGSTAAVQTKKPSAAALSPIMAPLTWGRQVEHTLIDLVRDQPPLWNTSHSTYTTKNFRVHILLLLCCFTLSSSCKASAQTPTAKIARLMASMHGDFASSAVFGLVFGCPAARVASSVVVVVFLEVPCAIISRDVSSNMLSHDAISQEKSDRVIRP